MRFGPEPSSLDTSISSEENACLIHGMGAEYFETKEEKLVAQQHGTILSMEPDTSEGRDDIEMRNYRQYEENCSLALALDANSAYVWQISSRDWQTLMHNLHGNGHELLRGGGGCVTSSARKTIRSNQCHYRKSKRKTFARG